MHTPTSRFRFGLARADVTPPIGIYHRMWGAATHDRATGIHRRLTATVMAFRPVQSVDDGRDQLALVALDHCLLWAPEMDELLRRVSEGTGTPVERIKVQFSHTHAAGLMGMERASLPGGELIAPYLRGLAETLIRLVREAERSLEVAVATYATGRCTLAANRDFWDEKSAQFVCGFNPHGHADETVSVARITAATTGCLRAIVVNYACHPTTLAWENTLISPDYPGAMREVVERETAAPCVFLQGASGDLGPREGFVGDIAVADRNGRQLGHSVLAALEAMPSPLTDFAYAGPVVSGATLGSWTQTALEPRRLSDVDRWRLTLREVPLPYRTDLPGLEATKAERAEWEQKYEQARSRDDEAAARDARAMIERMTRRITRLEALPQGESFPVPVFALCVGDAVWVGVEGEPYHDLQQSLRERLAPKPVIVMGLINGSRVSYLPTKDTYGKGIYQETIAVLAAGALEQLTEAVAAVISNDS